MPLDPWLICVKTFSQARNGIAELVVLAPSSFLKPKILGKDCPICETRSLKPMILKPAAGGPKNPEVKWSAGGTTSGKMLPSQTFFVTWLRHMIPVP